MTKKCFGTVAGLPLSAAVRAGDYVFVSGQMPLDDNFEIVPGPIEAQTRQTFKRLKAVLDMAGCTLEDVVKVTVWLDDTRDFNGFNKIYKEFFPENPPARSTVRSELVIDCKLEIEVVAYSPQKS